jgi:hypothetical protein
MKIRNVFLGKRLISLFLAAALFGTCLSAQAQNQTADIGFYVGDPTPSVAKPKYEAFVKTVKQTPHSTSLFIDYREPIWSAGLYDPKWRNNANWAAGNLAALVSPSQLNLVDAYGNPTFVPVIAVGLTDDPTVFRLTLPSSDPNYGKYSESAAIAMMNDVANGKYDLDDAKTGRHRVWPEIFDAFRTKGFNKLYLRIGWEQNGNWYGWRVSSEATKNAYIAAWRHVANLAHAYAANNGMTIETVWSPTASFSNYGIPEESSYPGDAYVDIIAPTAYSPIWNPTRSKDRTAYHDWSTKTDVSLSAWLANPVNRRVVWDYPSADYWNPTRGWGIPAAIAFAQSHGKRFGLSETGTGNFGVTTRGGGPIDDGDYPMYLAQRLVPALSKGLQLEFIDIWAQNSGTDNRNFLSGSRPFEATAWKELGANIAAAQARKNLAANRYSWASTRASTTYSADKVVDGKQSTRWQSGTNSDQQWIYVDLGQRYTVSRVRLTWDAAYATEYRIQTRMGNNTTAWTTIHATSIANGGVDDVIDLSGMGRYVRVYVTRRGTSARYYSLREIEIYP